MAHPVTKSFFGPLPFSALLCSALLQPPPKAQQAYAKMCRVPR